MSVKVRKEGEVFFVAIHHNGKQITCTLPVKDASDLIGRLYGNRPMLPSDNRKLFDLPRAIIEKLGEEMLAERVVNKLPQTRERD